MRVQTQTAPIVQLLARLPAASGLAACVALVLLLAPGSSAGAPPSFRGPLFVGPLAESFAPAAAATGLRPGRPLVPLAEQGLVEQRTRRDSTGVVVQRYVGGFPHGPMLVLTSEDYLRLSYAQQRQEGWEQRVRSQLRSATAQQLRGDGNRFTWTVPFPESRTLRRIIGDEGPSLSLNGHRTIIIAGKSEWTEGEVRTAASRPSKFPSLSMDQQSQFTVEGKVGELIDIRIQQDTESGWTTTSSTYGDQGANLIKLDYKGDEDAIFQEVQAGNTTLELPSTRFVGFRQQNKGLFGVRTRGRLGPLGLTAIASHEKSQSNRKTFRGGVSVDTTQIRDYAYLSNTYFFLDEFYRASLTDFRAVTTGTPLDPRDYVDASTLEVYVNDYSTMNDAETLAKEGIAWADLDDRREMTGWVERGTWHRLDPDDDYALVSELGYIILRQAVQDRHALAVIYRTRGGREFGSRQGEAMTLKLLKARDARPDFPTWNLMWKNVYRIGSSYGTGAKFDPATLRVNILKEVPGKEPQVAEGGRPYIQIMGLDQRGRDPNSPADRLIDADYIGLDKWRGHLIFPDQTPFAPQHPAYSDLAEPVPTIYTSRQQSELLAASRYIIEVVSSSGQQRISLGGALGGVKTESVEVSLNGRQLQRGADYNVDFVGNVAFLGAVAAEVADPAADLEITYETEDILGLGSQQKTLLGLRTEYEFWGGEGRVGGTMIYNNERSNERRVRVGAEPTRSVIWNMDLRLQRDVPLLTRMVDALPLVKTAERSALTLEAEIAESRPNLNTKGAGFIDDFEGSERPVTLSIGYTKWTPASVPGSGGLGADNRAPMIWYNPYDGVLRTEIWPGLEKQVDVQTKTTDVLSLELSPLAGRAVSWGGIMSAFASVADFSQAKFLEIWVRGAAGTLQVDLGAISEDVNGNGRLDTEDIPLPGQPTGDGVVSREEDIGIDGRDDGAELRHYLALAGVDTTGLDEAAARSRYLEAYPEGDPDDPEGDNWHYDSRFKDDYSRINGTQGNKADSATGDRPDTEDMNNDGVLNDRNDYYSYAIDLAADEHVPGSESDPTKPLDEIWRLFRLPLFGPHVSRTGRPDSSRVEFARVLVSGRPALGDGPTRVQIAAIEIVQNEWQEDDIVLLDGRYPVGADEGLNVTTIGTDRSLTYAPPRGVHIRRVVGSSTYEREQSLVLQYTDLEPGHQFSATKVLSPQQNYTDYRRLLMYVHGDSAAASYVRGDSSDIEIFVRFGADSTNYYEFVGQVFPGWEGGRRGWEGNRVDIDLLQISQLKAVLQTQRYDLFAVPLRYVVLEPRGAPVARQALLAPEELEDLRDRGLDPVVALQMEVVDPHCRDGQPALYRVRGTPSMQQIKQLTVGLRNRGESQRYSGEVWLDELRLDEARNDAGLAAYSRLNTRLADLGDVDTYVEWREQDFRTATGGGGTNSDLTTSVQTTVQMHKLLPGSWGLNIPVKTQILRQVSLPRFGPNSDVELTAIERDSLRSTAEKDYVDVSLSKRQGQHWLARWTVDQVNMRASHSSQRRSSPVRPRDDQQAQTASFSYRMPLPGVGLGILAWLPAPVPKTVRDLRVRYLPSNFSYSVNANRNRSWSYQASDVYDQTGEAPITYQETFRLNEDYTVKANVLPGTSTDYSLRVQRDLRKRFEPTALAFGTEVGRNQKADMSVNVRCVPWVDQNYTFTAEYAEDSDPANRQTGAVVDTATGRSIRTLDITAKNDLSARFSLRLPALLQWIGGRGGRGGRGGPAPARPPQPPRRVDLDPGEAPPGGSAPSSPPAPEPAPGAARRPFVLRRLFGAGSDYVEPLSATWRRNMNTNAFDLVRRPSLLYQLGIDDTLRVAKAGQGLTRQDAQSQITSLEGGAGLRLPFGLSLKSDYSAKLSRRSGSTQTRTRVTREERFPRLNLTWSRGDRIPYVRRFLTSAQVNASYASTHTDEGEGSVRRRALLTRGDSREVRASWNGRWKFGPTTTIERVLTDTEEWEYDLADATAGAPDLPPLRGSNEQQRATTSLTVRQNVRPRSLPLFGRLKSDIDLSLKYELESETRATGTGEAARAPIADNDKWKSELTLQYKFSENFRGEGLVRVENNDNRLTDRTRKIREVRLSGTFFLR